MSTWHIIVLNWNGRKDTLSCLASLQAIERDDVAVVCVDNGSSDGSPNAVRQAFPNVTVIEAISNLGFAGGNNLGIRHALAHGAKWVVLLNNDAVLAPDAIDAFEAAARQHPQAGILGGKVYFSESPDTIWFAGQRVNSRLGYSGRPRGYRRPDRRRYNAIVPTDRVVGAFMAASREAIEAAGAMDEALFLYVEDVEWAMRVRRAGFEVLMVPGARAWHRVSAASGGESRSLHTLYYGTRNTITVYERHHPLGPFGTTLRRCVVRATFSLHALARGGNRVAALRAVAAGYADARAARLGPWLRV